MGGYGHDGVAVCSRYELHKATLDGLLDEAHSGLVRYGTEHLRDTFNALEFITTKRSQYEPDREVRAFLTTYDRFAGGNRHFDINNLAHAARLRSTPAILGFLTANADGLICALCLRA